MRREYSSTIHLKKIGFVNERHMSIFYVQNQEQFDETDLQNLEEIERVCLMLSYN